MLANEPQPILVGTVARVIDGDTIDVRLASGPIRVRLHAVDAPERGQPGGRESTKALVVLVAGKQVEIEPFEQDSYHRLVGRVYVDGTDVNRMLVEQGHAWAFRQYMTRDDEAYCALEHTARTARHGLWALPPEQRIAPWEWRKQGRRLALADYSHETAENCIAAIGVRTAPPGPAAQSETTAEALTCGAKTYCRQMVSCEEARFHLATCGLTRLDGDSDGVPCETLCR